MYVRVNAPYSHRIHTSKDANASKSSESECAYKSLCRRVHHRGTATRVQPNEPRTVPAAVR